MNALPPTNPNGDPLVDVNNDGWLTQADFDAVVAYLDDPPHDGGC